MEVRYQVFVSSTYVDLQEERGEVLHALLELDCIPTGMELFPAADDDSWNLIKHFISRCDYYVVIIGGRYGSTTPSGKSYTEMEYDYAIEAGLPVLAFLHGTPDEIASKKTEQTEAGKNALAAFRKRIEDARTAKYWTSPADLAGKVSRSLLQTIRVRPRVGWVRGDLVANESAAQEILRLRRRIDELESHIADAEQTAPQGSDVLAQGDETIDLHFKYETGNTFPTDVEKISWNELLRILGPILINSASESELKGKLAEVFTNRYRDRVRPTLQSDIFNTRIRDEDFQKVKVQLRALGIMRELAGQGDRWKLTPYGDRKVMHVAAIHSKAV